ncbi:hypothetical protein A6V25_16250 [Nostoc sp. ATCC 53789]|nr:hypothetical protein A6V25_16250 [Nostoc sp. ATCC 53789]
MGGLSWGLKATGVIGVKVAKTHFAAMRRLKIILRLCFRKKIDFNLKRADFADQIHYFYSYQLNPSNF